MGPGEVVDTGMEAVPFPRMAEFLRLLAHDVRNDLNAVDLLTAYIRDIAAEPGVRGELDQLRTAIRYGSERMQRLSRAFQNPEPDRIPIPAAVLIEAIQARLAQADSGLFSRVRWTRVPEEGIVGVDVGLFEEVFRELLENAAAFSEPDAGVVFRVEVFAEEVHFIVEQNLEELPRGFAEWGKKPFVSTRRGHYGLGLFRVRRVLEAHGADLVFEAHPSRRVLEARVEFGRAGGVP
jgi:signal transduction histidine kinase